MKSVVAGFSLIVAVDPTEAKLKSRFKKFMEAVGLVI